MVKKVLMVVAHDTFRDEEYAHPLEVFRDAGYQVVTASNAPGKATGRFGLEVDVDTIIENVNATEFDAVVYVGGGGARVFFENSAAHKIAQTLNEQGRLVSAICIAPGILAQCGLLDGLEASVFPSENELLVSKGARISTQPITVSKKREGAIITANGPEAAYDFGRAIVAHLDGEVVS